MILQITVEFSRYSCVFTQRSVITDLFVDLSSSEYSVMVQMERETRCFFCLDLNWAERKGVGVGGRSGVRKLNHSQLNSSVLYMSVCV